MHLVTLSHYYPQVFVKARRSLTLYISELFPELCVYDWGRGQEGVDAGAR